MESKLPQWERDNHIASVGSYYAHMALTHYYFGEYREAERSLLGVRKYLSGLTDNVLKRQWHIFLVLNKLKLHERGIGCADRDELLADITPVLEKIETWAALGPLLRPYLAFLHAEVARVTGTFEEARSLYLDAINTAHEHKYTFLEGHLNESFGELLVQAGQCSERVYFVEAARLYKKCHATRKEMVLMERYPEYFDEERNSSPNLEAKTPAAYTLPDLDFDYLMKLSSAVSTETEHEALLKTIMNVVIECSGAESGYLLVEDAGTLFVHTESHIAEKDRERGQAMPVPVAGVELAVKPDGCSESEDPLRSLEETGGICKAIVRYVYRTGEKLTLNSAAQEGVFKDNPEVQGMQLRSVLCLPVMKQSKMIGILYLENRLSDAVFASRKSKMAEFLASWAAVYLENALLMEALARASEQASPRVAAAASNP